jgi:dihydrofolate synthase/folylpolyglutamate synthase
MTESRPLAPFSRMPDAALASVAWLESFVNFEKTPAKAPYAEREYSLGPFREFLAALGDPQDARPTLHVAGTKGKGSCAILLDRLARAAGLTTGRYTSPHLVSYRERIALNGEPISFEEFDRLFLDLKDRCERLGHPKDKKFRSLFELVTAGAWLLFRERRVDVAILEVGLGGRLDATNCVREPLAALVTSIGRDHTDLLGEDLAGIAREKGGIYKPGCPAIARRQDRPEGPEILAALREMAEKVGAPFIVASDRWTVAKAEASGGIRVSRQGEVIGDYPFGLMGEHQRGNLEACLATFEASGVGPSDNAGWRALLEKADLGAARHPGRLEIIRERPLVVADGAHCPLSIRAVLTALPEAFPQIERWEIAFGVLGTKRVEEMTQALRDAPSVEAIFPVSVDDPRALDRERLVEIVRHVAPDKARDPDDLGVIIRRRLAQSDAANPRLGLLVTGTLFNIRTAREAAASGGMRAED